VEGTDEVDCVATVSLPDDRLIVIVVNRVFPDRYMVVKVVVLSRGAYEGRETRRVGAPVSHREDMLDADDAGSEEMNKALSDAFFVRVMNRLGRATLFIHSVVPFTTEKRYVLRVGFDGEGLISETVTMGPGTVT
jgi:hypothetical protein